MNLIVFSKQDLASLNVLDKFEEAMGVSAEVGEVVKVSKGWSVFLSERDCIHSGEIVEKIGADLTLFVSRHSSSSGKPTLSVHTPGEICSKDLPYSSPRESWFLLRFMYEKASDLGISYDVCYEATHHGPNIPRRMTFIEIGSDEKAWTDPVAGEILASAIISLVEREKLPNTENFLGIGGPHYAPNFTKVALSTEVSLGHIVPKYKLELLNEDCLEELLERSFSDKILIDWKGTTRECREFLSDFCLSRGLEIKKTKEVV